MAMLGRGRNEEPAPVQKRVEASDAHTILGREARFSGKLAFEGAVRIDGTFEGEITTDDVLLIGQTAEVRAKLNVGSVIIHGHVEGDIIAKNSVDIKSGRVRGTIVTPALTIERGVVFDGTSRMSPENGRSGKAKNPAPPAPPPQEG